MYDTYIFKIPEVKKSSILMKDLPFLRPHLRKNVHVLDTNFLKLPVFSNIACAEIIKTCLFDIEFCVDYENKS